MTDTAKDAKARPVREAVGIFFDAQNLRDAIDDLRARGFERDEIGLLAGEFSVKQHLGPVKGKIAETEDDPKAPETEFVEEQSIGGALRSSLGGLGFVGAAAAGGAVVATAGVLGGAIAVAAAGVAAVGTVGAVLAKVIGESDAEYLDEQIAEGKLLLFVRTPDAARERVATETLTRHGAREVRVFTVDASGSEAKIAHGT